MKKLLYNGVVLSFDKGDCIRFFAVSLNDNKIENLYMNVDLEKFQEYECIDLDGKLVIPGFNDSHMHLINYGLQSYKVDFSKCKSIDEMKMEITSFLSNEDVDLIYGDWIVGYGWNENNFKNSRLPKKEDFDDITKDIPFFAPRICGHIALANTKAFNICNIDRTISDPYGGKYDRDENGEKTGILRENALFEVFNKIPLPKEKQLIKTIIIKTIEELNEFGITSVQTDDFSHVGSPRIVLECFDELRKEKRLNCRINEQQLFLKSEDLRQYLKDDFLFEDEYLKKGPLKLLTDGSLGAKTAALIDNYANTNQNGILAFSDDELDEFLTLALENNMDFAAHTIGDRAMIQVLDSKIRVEQSLEKKFERSKLVHCQIGNIDIFNKMNKENVSGCIQPLFLSTDYKVVDKNIDINTAKTSYAWKTMMDMGIHLSGSSDAPIDSFNPMLGIFAAVNRTDLENNPQNGWNIKEKLSVEEAIKLYTLNSAYDTGEEKIKGNIKVGYLADLIILSKNIFEMKLTEIDKIQIDGTIFDGKYVYKKR